MNGTILVISSERIEIHKDSCFSISKYEYALREKVITRDELDSLITCLVNDSVIKVYIKKSNSPKQNYQCHTYDILVAGCSVKAISFTCESSRNNVFDAIIERSWRRIN